ncbi:hypothetical protein [Alteraurantiacibacter aquimixticola]|uniref:LapA family protein n=1 Tax=Alteraurantiacibacter aquimixticola TaxID=2489173 RepID=A0A4T3F2L1_9SPHN|nr:hypothetical protein [Alteraurantiacibacter aquimixticola]TIX50320.1 hypothetical protein E5222_08550 [Alteraurantiacibacter aquimixticola]
MQVVRTVIWVLLLVALAIFSYANWIPVSVRIWDNLLVDTMLPAIIVVSFLIGFIPMWLYHRASKWQSNRRIVALESAARTAATTPVQKPGSADVAHPAEQPEPGAFAPEPEAPEDDKGAPLP